MLKQEIIQEINQAGFNDEIYNQVMNLLAGYNDELNPGQETEFFAALDKLIKEQGETAEMYREIAQTQEGVSKALEQVQAEFDTNMEAAAAILEEDANPVPPASEVVSQPA